MKTAARRLLFSLKRDFHLEVKTMHIPITLVLAGVFCLFLFIYTTALVLRRR